MPVRIAPSVTSGWAPNLLQASCLEQAGEAGLNRSITAVAVSAGVSRESLYRWLREDDQFRRAWDRVWRQAINNHLPGVVAAMVLKAQGGDVGAAKLVADLAGVITKNIVIEAKIREMAVAEGLDPDEAVREAQRLVKA